MIEGHTVWCTGMLLGWVWSGDDNSGSCLVSKSVGVILEWDVHQCSWGWFYAMSIDQRWVEIVITIVSLINLQLYVCWCDDVENILIPLYFRIRGLHGLRVIIQGDV